jgi:hypothetical protein
MILKNYQKKVLSLFLFLNKSKNFLGALIILPFSSNSGELHISYHIHRDEMIIKPR